MLSNFKLSLSFIFLVLFTAACGNEESSSQTNSGESMQQQAGPTQSAESEDQGTSAETSEAKQQTAEAFRPETHVVNAEARVFNPAIIYINPGDTVAWTNMTSHNTVSVEGLIPEGAEHWRGALGENLKIKLDIEGIYAYVCEPHIGFGMVGVIVVGKPDNLEAVKSKAQEILEGPYRRIIGKLNKVEIPQ